MTARDGVVYDLPEEEYHAPKDELSSTGAKLLLDSPAKFKHSFLDSNRVHKKAWDLGTVVHAKVLGVGWEVRELDFENYRTKAAQEARDETREAGLVPMLKHELAGAYAVAEAVLANPTARKLLEYESSPEVSVFSTCPETGVRLRARFDRLTDDRPLAIDLKTTAGSAAATEFARTIHNFGYDVQEAQYGDTLLYATGRDVEMVFIVVETAAPFLVNTIMIPQVWREMGRAKSMEARRRFRHGIDTGEWPGYSPEIKRPEPPMFAVYDYQDNYA
ncbi:PD-(D/E)XK nuclease-like domain-containing protein [Leucobacter sp. M11]|uniref:PD-(D/E)XK nuclease-like domain-containing protein n=1 Tax=Leucobacter sp. M11 TaxID=2993565 RepID=UPI002D7F621F|nr:PD-(D/E)XK nuclease-like domain-containing protein [Leucobacter sp. M11]MEB4614034.1 PD-(D/E)XK nuclease-like domain-containing protein [Leucobacter sp. M11]